MNNFSFTGNLGADAEERVTGNGTTVVSFSVGVKSGFGDKAKTIWVRCSYFGKGASAVSQYLTKGQSVGVTGEASLRDWEDRDGKTRTNLEVLVNSVTLLGKREGGEQRSEPQKRQEPQRKESQNQELSDDIPF